MSRKTIPFFSIIFFTILLVSIPAANAQKKLGLKPDAWATILSDATLNEVNSLGSLTNLLIDADSVRALSFLDSLKASRYAKGYYFQTFFCMVKADFLYTKFAGYDKFKDRGSKELKPIKAQLIKLYADALDAVYHTEKDIQIGWVSFYSAKRMRNFGEIGWAVMYSKNGVDLFEKVGYAVEPPVYNALAELLFQVREYEECITNAKKGIAAWKHLNYEKDYKDPYKYKIQALNLIGNCFYHKNQHDSANNYYMQAYLLATQNKDSLLTAKVMGNVGRIVYAQNKFDSAYTLFDADYQRNKGDSIYNEAADALQWKAKASLAMGKKAAALTEAKEAIRLLSLWPSGPYLSDTYQTLTQVYRAMGNYDSAFYYSDRYAALHDSLEKEVATSSLSISKAKLSIEESRFNIQKINRQKQAELLWRNIIIGFILVISLVALLFTNWQRLKEKIKSQSAQQEKKLIQQEMNSANEQLKMFTANIVEKTTFIEKLELQLKGRENTTEQQAIITELTLQTILTEDDWTTFKNLLEKIYPGFFHRLKENYIGITVAEQRMAALLKLRLTTKEAASMLGISTESARKTRQRLKHRLNLSSEINLEEYVASL
ncbi:hypothetical protein BH10BAC3_BH10BAC3_29750 [soil metagenome]